MAQVEFLQCASCGSPLGPGALECEYCGVKNVVKSKKNPLKITSDVARKYIAFYGEKTKENPKDTNALYSMGLLYMSLKNYELAQRNFKDAIDLSPLDADVYYYYALSLVSGRSIRAMNGKDVARVEEYIGTAMGMEEKCKYLVLLAAVKEEYYTTNHLVITGTGPRQLFEEAANFSPDDLEEITDNCTFNTTSVPYNIDLLTGKETEEDDDEEDDNDDAEDADEDDNDDDEDSLSDEEKEKILEEATNLTEEERKRYYDFRFEQVKPGSGEDVPEDVRYMNVPGFVGFGIKRALMLGLNFLLFLFLLTFGTCTGWGIKGNETINSIEKRVEERVEKAAKKDYTYPQDKLDEFYASFKADSIKSLEKDSVLRADCRKVFTYVDNKDGITQTFFMKKGFWGWFWVLVIFSPLIIWFFNTLAQIFIRIKDRKFAFAYNLQLDENYIMAKELYKSKPTDLQMSVFTLNFLDTVVDTELTYHKKSERDLKGMTLFLNNYFKYKDDGENYEDSAVEYVIALLEEDCVTVIRSDWRIYEDIQDTGEIEQVSYGDIRNVKLTENELSFGDITIEIPDEQALEYQNDDDSNSLTFSNTRTSNVNIFAVGLRKLVQAYKNR